MLTFTLVAEACRKLVQRQALRLTEIEDSEDRRLQAMSHWRDPDERLKALRCRCNSHTLLGDNPASG